MSLRDESYSVEFGVRVSYHAAGSSGYTIEVWDHEPGKPHKGRDFAKVNAGDLWTALHMALPYFAAKAEPDPLIELLRRLPEGEEDEVPAGSGPYGF